jgi:hypothetical protein
MRCRIGRSDGCASKMKERDCAICRRAHWNGSYLEWRGYGARGRSMWGYDKIVVESADNGACTTRTYTYPSTINE